MARLILDTGVLVAAARGRWAGARLDDADDLAVPALVVAEYLAGTLLDGDPGRAAAQRAFLDEVLATMPIQPYDRQVADHHAALLAHARRSGRPRGAHDLIVAASARATERTVVTTDQNARFDELPQVSARVIEG